MASMNVSNFLSSSATFQESCFPATCPWGNVDLPRDNSRIPPEQLFQLIVYPILLCICTVGNILCLVILCTDKHRTTTNVFLAVVAVTDICGMWCFLILYVAEAEVALGYSEKESMTIHFLNARGLIAFLNAFFFQVSDWTLIVFSLERLAFVYSPLRFRDGFGLKMAAILLALIVLLSAIFHMENLAWPYYLVQHPEKTGSELPCSLLRWNDIQTQAEQGMTIGKWLLLTSINLLIISKLIQRSISRLTLQPSLASNASAQKGVNSSNHLLIGSALLYFVAQGPYVIVACLNIASKPPHCTYNFSASDYTVAVTVTRIILLCNYSFNFIVYCLATKRFRTRIVERLQCGGRHSNTSSTLTGSSNDSSPQLQRFVSQSVSMQTRL